MKQDNSPLRDEEKIILPTLETPDQPELPEEGFVPYCADAESDGDRRQKRKIRILLVLIILIVCIFVFSIVSTKCNFYQKTVKSLRFDYTAGETTDETPDDDPGRCARAISAQIQEKTVTVHTYTYLFDDQGNLSNNISAYDYEKSASGTNMDIRIGSAKSLVTKKRSLRTGASGIEEQKGKTWEVSPDSRIPNLAEWFFATQSHDKIRFECAGAYETIVGKTNYLCEVWLMEDDSKAEPEYTTLYRYYDGSRLAGVRMLKSSEDVMYVFDITDYSFS